MHIHILGICGTFMGGIAAIAAQAGYKVSGCDANVYPPMSDQLADLGINLIEGFEASQLSIAPDYWVVGNVVSRGNPLIEAILDSGQHYLSGPQWLYEQVLRERQVIAVAGTHGKTTTTAMLRHIFGHCGKQPGYLIGGVPADDARSAACGSDPHFIIEADEYDTAFFDKRSKFVHYRPRIAVLNNLEFDHADIFQDLAQIQTQFHHLIRTVPGSGCLIRPARSEALDQVLARGAWTPVQTFGETGNWSLTDLQTDEQVSSFGVLLDGQSIGRCELAMAGAHNRLNALAAIAAASGAGIDPAGAVSAMSSFAGVRRRLELKGSVNGIAVVDDFAHHPTAIALTIAGLRERMNSGNGEPTGRILAVLEPRSNTMRSGDLNDQLAFSVDQADAVYCFAAQLPWNPDQVFKPVARKFRAFTELDKLVAKVVADARPNDTVLVMSNGGFGGIHAKLLTALRTAPVESKLD